ncbi:glycosyltransferase family 2 protein [Tropicimonas marinistellae]|uniref:glycosyltransferase family 2 protein n=1 Tax=Tropicimonas marinistellae TaxID=1739787 RepID=UPI00083759E0|nr:glycosyltransferase family A protein [Tropicimonas marinistellae]
MALIRKADVDVVLTCFNEGPYIEAAVQSVLAQSCAERIASITINDDGSAPDTLNVLRGLPDMDPRVRVLFGTGGAGISRQRNIAIQQGHATYVAVLDGDDIWASDKLARQLEIVDRDAQVGLVYSDYYVFPGQDLTRRRNAGILDISGAKNLARAYFVESPTIIPSTTLMRRTTLDAVGLFDERVEVFEDTDHIFRMARGCRFGFVGEPLTYKRVHPASITESRADLMAHHAFVSMKAATLEPDLQRHVPRRLSERARKLGNRAFIDGSRDLALSHLALAVRFAPLNLRALSSLFVVAMAPGLGRRYLSTFRRDKLDAFGVSDGRGSTRLPHVARNRTDIGGIGRDTMGPVDRSI